MGQTSTSINNCNVVLEMDNSGGTPVDISGSSNTVNLGFTKQIGSAFTFDGDYPIRVECKKDATLEVTVLYTELSTEARELIEDLYNAGGRRTISVYPYGKDTGNRYYTGEFRLESMDFALDAGSADPVMFNASFLPDGAVDFLKFAS